MDDSAGLVRPITLNVIGHVLAGGLAQAPSLDANQLVRRYITMAVGQPAIRDWAAPVLEQMLTLEGTKRPRAEQEIAQVTGLRRAEVRAVLNSLAQAALARPLDPAYGVWELAHDFIARAISFYLGRQRRDQWRLLAAYAAPGLFAALLGFLGVYEFAVARPERERREPILPDMVEIKPGEFCMGAHGKDDPPGDCLDVPVDPQAQDDEKPLHRVKIAAFLLGKYEVTLEEYERYAYDQGINSPGDGGFGADLDPKQRKRLPVVNVSWDDAKKYAAWLSEKTHKRFRLPTEAEWEYAARAGTATPYFWDKLPGTACDYANGFDRKHEAELKRQYAGITWASLPCDDAYAHSAPVGSFHSNAWGLHDMAGNVWEWVEGCHHDSHRGASADGKAWGNGTDCAGGRRVVRGGSWSLDSMNLRPATRFRDAATYRFFTLGFRLVQDF